MLFRISIALYAPVLLTPIGTFSVIRHSSESLLEPRILLPDFQGLPKNGDLKETDDSDEGSDEDAELVSKVDEVTSQVDDMRDEEDALNANAQNELKADESKIQEAIAQRSHTHGKNMKEPTGKQKGALREEENTMTHAGGRLAPEKAVERTQSEGGCLPESLAKITPKETEEEADLETLEEAMPRTELERLDDTIERLAPQEQTPYANEETSHEPIRPATLEEVNRDIIEAEEEVKKADLEQERQNEQDIEQELAQLEHEAISASTNTPPTSVKYTNKTSYEDDDVPSECEMPNKGGADSAVKTRSSQHVTNTEKVSKDADEEQDDDNDD